MGKMRNARHLLGATVHLEGKYFTTCGDEDKRAWFRVDHSNQYINHLDTSRFSIDRAVVLTTEPVVRPGIEPGKWYLGHVYDVVGGYVWVYSPEAGWAVPVNGDEIALVDRGPELKPAPKFKAPKLPFERERDARAAKARKRHEQANLARFHYAEATAAATPEPAPAPADPWDAITDMLTDAADVFAGV